MRKVVWLASWWPSRERPGYGIFNRRWAEIVARTCELQVFTPPSATLGHPETSKDRSYGVRELPFRELAGPLPATFRHADVIQLLSPSGWGVAWQLRAAATRVPCVVVDHSLGSDGYWERLPLRAKMLYRLAYRRATVAVGLNADHLARLKRLGLTDRPGLITVRVANVVDECFLRAGRSRSNVSRGIPASNPRFVHVSGLSDEQKNVTGILRGFALLLAVVPGAELHICGAGGDEPHLRQLAHSLGLSDESLRWRGQLGATALAEVFLDSDYLVMASRREVDGCAVSEALASRLAVLTTDAAGMRSKVTPDRGWLLPNGSPEVIAEGMLRAVRSSDFLPPALTGSEAFLPHHVSEAYTRAYERAIAGRRGTAYGSRRERTGESRRDVDESTDIR